VLRPIIAIVGRPNVGKSTLFNRLIGRRRSLVRDVPGVTRDRLYGTTVFERWQATVVDTGGFDPSSESDLVQGVRRQVLQAVDEADLIVFVVDGRAGVTGLDEEIAGILRKSGRPVLLAVNKVEAAGQDAPLGDAYRLGFAPVLTLSAEHGRGVAELLEACRERAPAVTSEATTEGTRVAIIGRPNVGKSSLVNRLLKEERSIVSDMPGTTRDTVDSVLKWHKRNFRILDTAGIRRPGRVARAGQVESVSVLLARRAIEQADVAVLVVDATEGATDQDATIAGEAENTGCGVIVVANKWDLMKGRGPDFSKEFDDKLRQQIKFLDYAQILHISARTGERTPKLLEAIDRVAAARQRRIPTAELNRFVQAVTAVHPPASPGRREVRILYAVQTGVEPPEFVFFTNVATSFHFSYERFLMNRLRESFGMEGTPIRIKVRRRGK
jgi:GTP-binding protein